MSVRLARRDLKVLVKCAAGKWLTTTQLRRLCFAEVSADAARKALRKLAEEGLMKTVQENRMTDALHGLGAKGAAVLSGRGFNAEPARKAPRQREHMIGINDLRVSVEAEPERVAYFFACWELPGLGWSFPAIPDAVFALRGAAGRTFFCEYDRGTEGTGVVARKLRLYEEGIRILPITAVVLVVDVDSRLELLSRNVPSGRVPVLGTLLSGIAAEGIYGSVLRRLGGPGDEGLRLSDVSIQGL